MLRITLIQALEATSYTHYSPTRPVGPSVAASAPAASSTNEKDIFPLLNAPI